MSRHDPRVAMHHMRDHAAEALDLLGDKSDEAIEQDRVLQLALIRLVEVVGEAASRVPDDVRAAHADIPWREAASMRNLLIHAYETIRVDILCQTIREDFPALIAALGRVLGQDARDG